MLRADASIVKAGALIGPWSWPKKNKKQKMNPFLQVLAFRIAPLCPRLALCLRRVHPYLARRFLFLLQLGFCT